jgi:hypothetical protein
MSDWTAQPIRLLAALMAALSILATGIEGQLLPDAQQNFTGYVYQSGSSGPMVSPDGFFVLTSSDDAVLAADQWGAYFNGNQTAHGPSGLSQFMEIRANPGSSLGTFRLQSMVVGDGIVGPSHHRDIQVLGYRDGVVVAQTGIHESPTAEANWSLDYSDFVGKQIDAIRVTFTVVDGTPRTDFNLESFTIADAELPRTQATVVTAAATSVTQTSATLGGEVSAEGDDPVTASGIVWSIGAEPTLADSVVVMGSGPGLFSAGVTGLPSGTLIHVRAFATSEAGTA